MHLACGPGSQPLVKLKDGCALRHVGGAEDSRVVRACRGEVPFFQMDRSAIGSPWEMDLRFALMGRSKSGAGPNGGIVGNWVGVNMLRSL